MLIRDEDLVVWYLKSHRGPEPSDRLYAPFEDIGRWNKEKPDDAHSGALDNKTPKNHESARAHLQ